ncbi:MAG: hypothetical protein IKV74_00210 [Clostridia bacterium]|nr:hypothetical protein [Clostridia bacterium]
MFEQCKWIWGSAQAKPDEYMDFKLSFHARAGKKYALHLSCDTDYALYSEGKLVSFGQYGDYPDYKVYDTISLDDVVCEGENEFILTVYYMGVDTQTYIKKPAGAIFQITEDDQAILCSSENIPSRVTPGYVPYQEIQITVQLGYSCLYDANLEAAPFNAGSFPVDGLSKDLYPRPVKKLELADRPMATVVQSGGYYAYKGEVKKLSQYMDRAGLVVRTDEPVKVLGAGEQVTVKGLPGEDGVYAILDMGTETAGFLDMDFTVDAPCDVMIGWGEHLLDGRCRTSIRNFVLCYKAKAGRNQFLHPFRRLGCKYVQIFIAADCAKLDYVGVRETFYPLNVKKYASGNLLRDRICDVAVNTLRQCMHEHYEDCPWREQALYTMDSRNQMLCGYYAFGETEFPRASLNLVSHGMREDGLLSICYPSGLDVPIPSFSLAYFIQMWEYLVYSKDADFLREKYPFLQKLLGTFLRRQREDGLINDFNEKPEYWNFYEWTYGMIGLETMEQTGFMVIPTPLNAMLSLAMQKLANIAEALGYDADAATYRTEAKRINEALAKAFYNPETKLFESFDCRNQGDYSVLTNSLCVLCGAADGVDTSVILKVMVDNGPADTGLMVRSSTLSMNAFRFDALLKVDQEKYGPVILAEIDRIYMDMLQKDATSFWETALGAADFEGAGSLCHGWSALPLYYYEILKG